MADSELSHPGGGSRDRARNERLTNKGSLQLEKNLSEELQRIALKACDHKVRAFAECAKAQGMLVVFKCRGENREMNECCRQYTNPEAFAAYKVKRMAELDATGGGHR